jgi:hypothetical protein
LLKTGKTFLLALVLSLSLGACSPKDKSTPVPDATTLLQAIPPADAGQYDRIRDMKKWRNPFLIIRSDGVGLLDPADNAEIVLKPEQLLPALARLPSSAWPYGRVVAAQENGVRNSEQDGIAIRRNKGIVGGILAGAHINIEWVLSA